MINLKFNHIGVAVKSIKNELKLFEMLGYKQISDFFEDKNQGIRGVFIKAPNQPTLELVENIDENGPLNNIITKGIKFYHFAYETSNIEDDLSSLVDEGAIVIKPILDAEYYDKVAFLMLRNRMIVELVQLK